MPPQLSKNIVSLIFRHQFLGDSLQLGNFYWFCLLPFLYIRLPSLSGKYVMYEELSTLILIMSYTIHTIILHT